MKLYNTLSRQVEEFTPINEEEVKMYSCGPTVYDYAHIGNFRSFLFGDLLKRSLQHFGYDVNHVMNFTDVDDKTIKASIEEEMPLDLYTELYKRAFFVDVSKLKIRKADTYCSATEHIPEMVDLVKVLMDKGFAYKADDGSIYFDTVKFDKYGKLSNIKLEDMISGARVTQDEYAKEKAQDFAVWKAYTLEDGDVFWETELGKGRPGWHIECSAMSMKYLGEHFDIHIGGIDNMFPHHENEIAQSEAATDHTFVNYWLHPKHLFVDKKKMSKSSGNFYTVRDVLKKGYSASAIRFLLMANAHYRNELNVTDNSLHAAQIAVDKINQFVYKLDDYIESDLDVRDFQSLNYRAFQGTFQFDSWLGYDLNLPKAVTVMFDVMKYANKCEASNNGLTRNNAQELRKFMDYANDVLDVIDERPVEEEPRDPRLIAKLEKFVESREEYRAQKRYITADDIRSAIIREGYYVDDTLDGPKLRKLTGKEQGYVILDVLEGFV